MVTCTGAYGFSMRSNYNSRPRAAEILTDKTTARIIMNKKYFHDFD